MTYFHYLYFNIMFRLIFNNSDMFLNFKRGMPVLAWRGLKSDQSYFANPFQSLLAGGLIDGARCKISQFISRDPSPLAAAGRVDRRFDRLFKTSEDKADCLMLFSQLLLNSYYIQTSL